MPMFDDDQTGPSAEAEAPMVLDMSELPALVAAAGAPSDVPDGDDPSLRSCIGDFRAFVVARQTLDDLERRVELAIRAGERDAAFAAYAAGRYHARRGELIAAVGEPYASMFTEGPYALGTIAEGCESLPVVLATISEATQIVGVLASWTQIQFSERVRHVQEMAGVRQLDEAEAKLTKGDGSDSAKGGTYL